MSDIEIHHLGAAYALDALDARERAAFEAHYATCEICRTDVREMRQATADLAGLASTTPPPELRARVLADIATTRQLSPLPETVVRLADRRRSRPFAVAVAAAAAVLCFVVGALVVAGRGGDAFGDEMAEMMMEPDVGVAHLTGGEGAITVVWNDERAAVMADGLPTPTDGMAYELWLIDAAGRPVPMRLLTPADDGEVHAMLPVDATAMPPSAWGVTIEPMTGSDAPTSDVIYSAPVTA